MQEPKNSCAVTEKTNDTDGSDVLAVDKIEWKPVSKKQTNDRSKPRFRNRARCLAKILTQREYREKKRHGS
jgi:hypothetical protein